MFFMLCLFPIALTTPLELASSRKHLLDSTYIILFCLHVDRTIYKQHLHWPVFLTYKASLVRCMMYSYYSLSNLVLILFSFPQFPLLFLVQAAKANESPYASITQRYEVWSNHVEKILLILTDFTD